MKRKVTFLMAVIMLLGTLAGCRADQLPETTFPGAETTVKETDARKTTVPADGNPDDVTCKGSYTGEVNASQVVAKVGSRSLTNGQLQAYYWAEAAAYRYSGEKVQPDFSRPLDEQPCPLDEEAASWQQYFLKRALNAWHGAEALVLKSENDTIEFHPEFHPNPKTHKDNTEGKPATKFLYGYNDKYQLNTMHEEYLESLPDRLEALAQEKGYADVSDMAQKAFGTSEKDLEAYAELYNQGYMYMTFLGYDLAPEEADVESWFEEHKEAYAEEGTVQGAGQNVDIRHILVSSQEEAEALLAEWAKNPKANEASFAEMAVFHSKDTGSARDGGAYHGLRKGQLTKDLDTWCFDSARQPGDTEVIHTELGWHILYFAGTTDIWFAQAKKDLTAHMQSSLVADARKEYPMEVGYQAITLADADANVGAGEILYPDVAHERFPEAPVYLQQDFPNTMYGGNLVRTHGCGITTMAMLATYMTDTPLILPIMCERYGRYCHNNGTDGMIFIYEPKEMGFYFRERVYTPEQALEALKQGYPVVCVQRVGYWTRGGHYLLLEELAEDGRVRVRDSNIANYGRLDGHKEDLFDWSTIPPNALGYWIFEKKVTRIPACTRCGEPEQQTGMIAQDYLCHKCETALVRRDAYLNACGQ